MQDQFCAYYVVGCDPVLQAVGSPGILPQIASQGGYLLTRGIWHVEKSFFKKPILQVEGDDTRFHGDSTIGNVYLQDPVHPGEVDHDTPPGGNGPTTQIGS